MPPSTTQQSHARSHALLLLQKLLNLRDSASPLTLILDTLEQSGKPVLREFMSRAQSSKTKIVYVSFATLRRPAGVDIFVRARGKAAETLRSEIISHCPPGHTRKTLLVIDELNPLSASIPSDLPLFLTSLITSPSLSLVALYHADVPLSLSPSLSHSLPFPSSPPSSSFTTSSSFSYSSYAPHPLTVLTHLATAVLRTSSLHHVVERRRARNRSQPEPDFGLAEGREGVLIGLGARTGKVAAAGPAATTQGLVLEMELRRRSGRAVAATFVLVPGSGSGSGLGLSLGLGPISTTTTTMTSPIPDQLQQLPSKLYLLSDHLASLDPESATSSAHGAPGAGDEEPGSTFDLSLTEKQRRDREGVVLPYFDAQTDVGGAGEGGRILYEMGREDDFDEEEDEI